MAGRSGRKMRNSAGLNAWRKGQYRCFDKQEVSIMAQSESTMIVMHCAMSGMG
jgi:hypothetical protein